MIRATEIGCGRWFHGLGMPIRFFVLLNLRTTVRDVVAAIPGWSLALGEYGSILRCILSKCEICQHASGWAQSRHPSHENRRGNRGGSGWRAKAGMAEAAIVPWRVEVVQNGQYLTL